MFDYKAMSYTNLRNAAPFKGMTVTPGTALVVSLMFVTVGMGVLAHTVTHGTLDGTMMFFGVAGAITILTFAFLSDMGAGPINTTKALVSLVAVAGVEGGKETLYDIGQGIKTRLTRTE